MIDTAARRAGWVAAAAALAYVPNNPLVRLEAVVGLSPAPLERYLGVKNAFSGMTEGMHRLVHGQVTEALAANFLTPLMVCAVLIWAAKGGRLTTRHQECCAALIFIVLSVLVNVAHPLP